MGDLTQHFSRHEFTCRCPENHDQLEPPVSLLVVLEILRRDTGGHPLRIVSGYRCVTHNNAVDGAFASRHMEGDAVDIPAGYATVAQAEAAGAVGIGESGGWAIHLDTRPGPAARWSY